MRNRPLADIINSKWLSRNAYSLATTVTIIGSVLLVGSLPAQSANRQCLIRVNKIGGFIENSQNIITDARFESISQIIPDDLFKNGYPVNSKYSETVARLLPDEDTYLLTMNSGHPYVIVRLNRVFEGFLKTIAFDISSTMKDGLISCETLKSWREEFRGTEHLLTGLVNHLAGSPEILSVGESFIEAEAAAYIERHEAYPLDKMKKRYRQILAMAQAMTSGSGQSLQTRFQYLRESLKSFGIENYCRDHISFKDFTELSCTNCQGQTFLFVALLLDLDFKDEDPWRIGVQLLKDHIRPVLYDGKNVVDLVYAKIGPDTGDPIFSPKALLYLALKNHASELPIHFINQFDQETLNKPLNQNLILWLASHVPSFESSTAVKIINIQTNLILYDFSGIFTRSNFADGAIPEKIHLNLNGDIANPTKIGGHGSGDRSQTKAPHKIYCSKESILYEILNAREKLDLEQILETKQLTESQYQNYGWSCPGNGFSLKGLEPNKYWTVQLPAELLKTININAPYKTKMHIIHQYFIQRYTASLDRLTTILSEPFIQMFEDLQREAIELHSNFNAFQGAERQLYGIDEQDGLGTTETVNALIRAAQAYFELETRIKNNQKAFLATLNNLSADNLTAEEHDNVWTYIIRDAFTSVSNKTFFALIESTLEIDFEKAKHLIYPLAVPISEIFLSDDFRIALQPLKKSQLLKLKKMLPNVPVSILNRAQVGPKVTAPQFPLPISQVEFAQYCQKNHAQYYMNGSVAWECPIVTENILQQKMIIPKDYIVSEEAMFFMISSLMNYLPPQVLTRVASAVTPHFLQNQNPQRYIRIDLFKHILAGSYYLLSSTNPTIELNCVEKDSVTSCRTDIHNLDLANFKPVGQNDTAAPYWVHSSSDWKAWRMAIDNLYGELQSEIQIPKYEKNYPELLKQSIYKYGVPLYLNTANDTSSYYYNRFVLFGELNNPTLSILPGPPMPPAPTATPYSPYSSK